MRMYERDRQSARYGVWERDKASIMREAENVEVKNRECVKGNLRVRGKTFDKERK